MERIFGTGIRVMKEVNVGLCHAFSLVVMLVSCSILLGCASSPKSNPPKPESVASVTPSKVPGWYVERSVPARPPAEWVGYGEGKTQREAVTNAIAQISEQLGQRIHSVFVVVEKEENGQHVILVEARTKASSEHYLEEIQVPRSQREEGIWYVAAVYERLSFVQRMAKDLDTTGLRCNRIDWQGSLWLRENPLTEALTQAFSPYRSMDGTACRIHLRLGRKDKRWHLDAYTVSRPIPDGDFSDLLSRRWVPQEGLSFQFEGGKTTVRDDQPLRFSLQSRRGGYASLINVFADGRVKVVNSNVPISASMPVYLPDFELVSVPLHTGKSTKDVYLALVSNQPLSLEFHETGLDVIETGETEYALHKLMRLLDEVEGLMVGGVVLLVEP